MAISKEDEQLKQSTSQHLSKLEVSDSKFLGYVITTKTKQDVIKIQNILKETHATAAHAPYAWLSKHDNDGGYDEDDEPNQAVGPYILHELKEFYRDNHDIVQKKCLDDIIAIHVVRYFGGTLLGVSNGRLSQCYKHISKLSIHRYFYGEESPISIQYMKNDSNLYGLASGDCELLLNVMPEEDGDLFNRIKNELQFDGFKGSYNEVLPRLQNLQADMQNNTPVYRYPGNYNGTEWITYPFSPSSQSIKTKIQSILNTSIYQTDVNHCVTNYYRDNKDFIQHHNDKTLDLNDKGVIISYTLGSSSRIFELRRKVIPHDVYQVQLPHNSMILLGPRTNQEFTHSILQSDDESDGERISLTFRQVTTFLDVHSGRIFGQGSALSLRTLSDVRKRCMYENRIITMLSTFVSGIIGSFTFGKKQSKQFDTIDKSTNDTKAIILLSSFTISLSLATTFLLRCIRDVYYKRLEERMARKFFTSTSVTGSKY